MYLQKGFDTTFFIKVRPLLVKMLLEEFKEVGPLNAIANKPQ
jgi:hypothetical protein